MKTSSRKSRCRAQIRTGHLQRTIGSVTASANLLGERLLTEKLLVGQLLKTFFAFYGTRRFITVLTTALRRNENDQPQTHNECLQLNTQDVHLGHNCALTHKWHTAHPLCEVMSPQTRFGYKPKYHVHNNLSVRAFRDL